MTRRNYLRYILSSEKAWHTNCYVVPYGDTAYVDGTRYLDPDFVLRELCLCRDEDQRIEQELTPHDRVLTYDYTEIFPGNWSAISHEFLERFADWRGIDNAFTGKPDVQEAVVATAPRDNRKLRRDRCGAARRAVRVLPRRRAGVPIRRGAASLPRCRNDAWYAPRTATRLAMPGAA